MSNYSAKYDYVFCLSSPPASPERLAMAGRRKGRNPNKIFTPCNAKHISLGQSILLILSKRLFMKKGPGKSPGAFQLEVYVFSLQPSDL